LTITKLATPPGDDKLAFKGQMMLPFPFSPASIPVRAAPAFSLRGRRVFCSTVTIPGGAFDPTTHNRLASEHAGTAWTYKARPASSGFARCR